LSINALPAYLLERMGIPPTRLLAVSAAVRDSIPVLGRYSRGVDGKIWKLEDLPSDQQRMLEAYRLLQYDLLFGKQYSFCRSGPVGCPEEH